MSRKKENTLDLLAILPWWVSNLAAGIAYVVLAHIAPALRASDPILQSILNAAPSRAPLFALILLIPAPMSALNAWRKRKLFEQQENTASIRSLSWKQFEELVAEAYRRQRFPMVENSRSGADGNVDNRLIKEGKAHLVQCNQWKSNKAPPSVKQPVVSLDRVS